jgi:6-pyruvoyltetrahydropterin/6-carboxytetrahydropterin synthase
MHKLGREVRFSINPFMGETPAGHNSFASNPAGEGLALYFGLFVELEGPVEPSTGFIVNVVDIDLAVRRHVVDVFSDTIGAAYRNRREVLLLDIVTMLRTSWQRLTGRFGDAELTELSLALNPYRKIAILAEDISVYQFSEKFEFAAMHKLWNDQFTAEQNFGVFGKCANPAGHGHNYTLEVTVTAESSSGLKIGEFEAVVDGRFISAVDHKNLNADVPQFKNLIPTVENIASVAWDCLNGQFQSAKLVEVSVWETDKTYCSYRGLQ